MRRPNRPTVDLLSQIATREEGDACPDRTRVAAQKPRIVPIPGTLKLERLDESGAAAIELMSHDLREIAVGHRRAQRPGGRAPKVADR